MFQLTSQVPFLNSLGSIMISLAEKINSFTQKWKTEIVEKNSHYQFEGTLENKRKKSNTGLSCKNS